MSKRPQDGDVESDAKRQHSEVVCYGSLCEINTRLLGTYQRFLKSLSEGDTFVEGVYCIQIISFEDTLVLRTLSERHVAVLNIRTASALYKAKELSDFTLLAYVHRSKVDQVCLSESGKEEKAKFFDFPIEVNLYGTHDEAKAIGNQLSESGLFLQPPRFLQQHMVYSNPQELHFSGTVDFENGIDQSVLVLPVAQQEDSQSPPILQNIIQHDQLDSMVVHSKITRKLYPHQRQGVAFILRRESGQLLPSQSLWKFHDQNEAPSYYRHLITGTKQSTLPEEVRGGIVADDMGLGKTLMVLTALVHTLEDAKDFARQRKSQERLERGLRPATKATLVIVSTVLIVDVWIHQANSHIEHGTLKRHKYHGPLKDIDHKALEDLDLVITTYGTVAHDFHRGRRFLHSVDWFRIILDEAHVIRTQTTRQFQSIVTLSAQRRWCLTGTPIQNGIKDLGSLTKFLRVPTFESARPFQDLIASQASSQNPDRFDNLRILLGSICIRRTKELLNLPKPISEEKTITFTKSEAREYRNILLRFKSQRDRAIGTGNILELRTSLPRMFLRLRIFCNMGTYADKGETSTISDSLDADELFSLLEQSNSAFCECCSKGVLSIGVKVDERCGQLFSCDHLVCASCISDSDKYGDEEKSLRDTLCPMCIDKDSDEEMEVQTRGVDQPGAHNLPVGTNLNDSSSLPRVSSKLNALLEDIVRSPKGTKSLVFSCWTRTLNVVASLLDVQGLTYRRIHGDMSVAERRKALKDFEDHDQVSLLLMTIGCGAEGLSLVTANTIHILERQWNPAMEQQAIGRAVRLGQKRQVRVVRYAVKRTLEEKVERFQQQKIELAGGGFMDQSTETAERELVAHMDEMLSGDPVRSERSVGV